MRALGMLKCTKCGRYTLERKCPSCKSAVAEASPPRFSASDRFGKYRRMAKEKAYGNGNKCH